MATYQLCITFSRDMKIIAHFTDREKQPHISYTIFTFFIAGSEVYIVYCFHDGVDLRKAPEIQRFHRKTSPDRFKVPLLNS